MLSLRTLDGQLVRRELRDGREILAHVTTVLEADGVMFLCPKCYRDAGSDVGVHSVICWFVDRVPDDVSPRPGRWQPSGTTVDDLSFIGPSAASVALGGGCGAHFFIRGGMATF